MKRVRQRCGVAAERGWCWMAAGMLAAQIAAGSHVLAQEVPLTAVRTTPGVEYRQVARDAGGGFVVAGRLVGTARVAGASFVPRSGRESLIIGFEDALTPSWAAYASGEVVALSVSPERGTWVAMNFQGALRVDDAQRPNALTMQSEGGSDAVAVALDADGTVQRWVRLSGGSATDVFSGIVVGSGGALYLSGTFNGCCTSTGFAMIRTSTGTVSKLDAIGYATGFVLQVLPSGAIGWTARYGGRDGGMVVRGMTDANESVAVTLHGPSQTTGALADGTGKVWRQACDRLECHVVATLDGRSGAMRWASRYLARSATSIVFEPAFAEEPGPWAPLRNRVVDRLRGASLPTTAATSAPDLAHGVARLIVDAIRWESLLAQVLPRRPELADRLRPQGEFESDAEYRARLQAVEPELRRLAEEERRLMAAEEERKMAERNARIAASRRKVVVRDPVLLERYDPNAERYPVSVGGVRQELAIPRNEARLLSENRERIVVEAIEQLAGDLTKTERFNLQLVHPVTGQRYAIGRQVEFREVASAAAVRAPAVLSVEAPRFTDADGDNRLGAGERAVLEFTVRNAGQGPAREVRVQGITTAPIDGLRAPLGTINPGETRTVTLAVTGGAAVRDTTAVLRLEVTEANGFDAPPLEVRIPTRAFRPPVLGVAGVGVEDAQGRSVISAGLPVTLTIRVQNNGGGRAEGVVAEIVAGPNVFLADESSNRTVSRAVGDLEPGAYRDVQVQAFANAKAERGFPITVALRERSGRFAVAAKDLGLTQETAQRSVAQLDIIARDRPASEGAAAVPTLGSDLLANIPLAKARLPDAIAVIIGNRAYRNAPSVAFAANDAAVVRRYAERALGIEPGNILELPDATLSDLKRMFGERGNPNGRLKQLVKPGVSEVFVFYSGHGAPDPGSQGAYLMPIDADANALPLTGLAVDVLYENLAALGATHVTVVLDACFSGATGGGEMLITAASPIGIAVRDPAARFAQGNATIIAAAQGQELANWYPAQRHGMLTYYFLKGLQGSADVDGDQQVTVAELRAWLTNPTRGVPYEARRVHGREQTPQVFGKDDRVVRP